MTTLENIQQCIDIYKPREEKLSKLLANRTYIRRKKFDREVAGTYEEKELLWGTVYKQSDYWLKQELADVRELLDSLKYLFEIYQNESSGGNPTNPATVQ